MLGCEIWKALADLSNNTHFTLIWVPTHCLLEGNEEADTQAREASQTQQTGNSIDLSTAKAALKRRTRGKADDTYNACPHTKHHRAATGGRGMAEIGNLPRHLEVCIHQLRTGHTPICRSYLHRIGKAPSPMCGRCNVEEDVEHTLIDCPRWRRQRYKHLGPAPTLEVLHTRVKQVADYLRELGAVNRPPE